MVSAKDSALHDAHDQIRALQAQLQDAHASVHVHRQEKESALQAVRL